MKAFLEGFTQMPGRLNSPLGPEDCGRKTLASQLFKSLNPSFREELDAETGKKRKRGRMEGEVVDLNQILPLLWTSYFGEGVSQEHEGERLIKIIKERISAKLIVINLDEVEREGKVTLDYHLLRHPIYDVDLLDPAGREEAIAKFEQETQFLMKDLYSKPKLVSAAFLFAVHEIHLSQNKTQDEIDALADSEKIRPLVMRLKNHYPTTPMGGLKTNMIEKLVTIHGTVVRASSVKPLAIQVEFVCPSCRKSQTIRFNDGKYQVPHSCNTTGCRSRFLHPERGMDSATITRDFQTLRIQELKTNDKEEDLGRVPRTIDCELTDEQVDQVIPGDVVECTGILKLRKTNEGGSRGANTMHVVYLDTLYIAKVNSQQEKGHVRSKDGAEFNDQDLQMVEAVFNEPHLLRLLVNSFCHEIFGHEPVKLGMLLALFGGRKRHHLRQEAVSIRGDPHVLVVGDPGLGKSQMLMAAVNLAPRGVYVCASSGISSSGLTVTLVKEAGSNDFALEAGALVLGDQGCCCIDEFDKMQTEHAALLEAMEQQSISIAKAGIVCSLPARTSVIAAANPAGGHYNKAKTVSENLRMGAALLSRFDLVFILLDKPDVVMDDHLSRHVMALHSGKELGSVASLPTLDPSTQGPIPLVLRLRLPPGEAFDRLPTIQFRKYIAYARAHVHPRLSPEAATILKTFYLELRRNYRSRDAAPITTRQLESLVRLAEARAKMELRESVTEQDAYDVVELMKLSLFDAYADDEGVLDFQRSQHGSGMTQKSDVKRFIVKLNKISDETFSNNFTYTRLYQISKGNIIL
ncbi:DNA replication licensing factor mcm8, variant 2 [Entomophthora muscae]|uniref:DNA replication licensing factor mcm8, variant 2 n=1 Tax=Entomophthora muscae TaxID=34485 RepID=A0ACC2SSU1_9FUNG|nr:DNA replication licensing factor mcm8, variant 2 [Entomophthora muscae]